MGKALITAAVLAAALAAAVPAAPATTPVAVTLKEFTLTPKPTSAKAGKVAFTARNTGSIDHEFLVLRTNTAPAKLKVVNSKAVETGKVGRVAVKKGQTRKLTLSLKAGKYVLLCNLPAHYQAGQRAAFVVK